MTDEIFDIIVHKVTVEKGLEFAAYHPRFIVDQVVATCRFMRETPHFEPRFIDYAIDNLRVRHSFEEAACGNIRPDVPISNWLASPDASNFSAPGSSNLRIKLEKRVEALLELPLDLLA